MERQRRSEQKGLFDKLVNLLNVDPKTPRLHLLTMVSVTTFAVKTTVNVRDEIQAKIKPKVPDAKKKKGRNCCWS